MSASILHKEIEIGHNGVHYKVVVDAEKQHGTVHNLSGLENGTEEPEHQEEPGKIGIHYELPEIEHLHHHDEEDKHHGVVIHIDLNGAHSSEEEEHHNEHHDEEHRDAQKHYEVHHVLVHPHHDAAQYHYDTENHDLIHHLHPELGLHDFEHEKLNPYNSKHHQIISYEDLGHLLTQHDSRENELEYNRVDVPHHHVIGPQVWGKHHGQKQHYVVGHQNGNLWQLFPSKVVNPVSIHSGIPHSTHVGLENVYDQGHINEEPFVELHALHHHVDIHH
ncbi:histidine-rich glycoprotein-like [Anoplophora glabripennis]|uniref:histidine-rich glycoprotein-like n=1 Tax=Anoplophora glabripennis TaxID=217634 RepID=UPI000C773EBB|nr:histidine-rich glycoprotein-like [Anoplophora glabripennis]